MNHSWDNGIADPPGRTRDPARAGLLVVVNDEWVARATGEGTPGSASRGGSRDTVIFMNPNFSRQDYKLTSPPPLPPPTPPPPPPPPPPLPPPPTTPPLTTPPTPRQLPRIIWQETVVPAATTTTTTPPPPTTPPTPTPTPLPPPTPPPPPPPPTPSPPPTPTPTPPPPTTTPPPPPTPTPSPPPTPTPMPPPPTTTPPSPPTPTPTPPPPTTTPSPSPTPPPPTPTPTPSTSGGRSNARKSSSKSSSSSSSSSARRSSSSSSASSASTYLPTDELRIFNPISVELDLRDMSGVLIESDVDSILVAATTLEPFVCKTVMTVETRPPAIHRCANVKLTTYLNNREKFQLLRPATFVARPDEASAKRIWYECKLTTVDQRLLYMLFQTEGDSTATQAEIEATAAVSDSDSEQPAFRRSSGRERDRPLCRATLSFIRDVIIAAAKNLPTSTVTARTGITATEYEVARKFNVAQQDFGRYARLVTQQLSNLDLLNTHGIHVVRFYQCMHGLRLPCEHAA
ncbi:wiskott-Aldrich syndrome protein family member 2-like [Temnothorax curvispinosus]|uniref:Wiskott-Aldrich syndrome protein family member 2-like n=1 Tax=Temnothorax curvispinosus TaxID=300111 RepID=A0A6J1Q9R5_9HYME|nr:wiskott-Aldrich syndrome protein family member 2-like [Temnothorax curvispinosus]